MDIITGKIQKAQKVLIYGVEGIGKSTFASKFPDPLFIDTEGSTNHMDVKRTQPPTSWAMLVNQVREVKAKPSICKTLVIDTIDWAEKLCVQHICSTIPHDKGMPIKGIEDYGYGKGYTYLYEEFARFLNLLTELTDVGINVVLTAHSMIKQTELPEETGKYEFWTLKLEKKTAPLVKEWADMVLFANYKTLVIQQKTGNAKAQGGQRVMYTTHRTTWDAKNRHDFPEELPFDYNSIAHAFPNEIQASINKLDAVLNQSTQKEPQVQNAAPVAPPPQEEIPIISEVAPANPLPPPIDRTAYKEPDWNEWIKTHKTDWTVPPIPPGKEYLKPLYDLMATNGISDMMIRAAMLKKGFATESQLIENYPKETIEMGLIGQWDSFYKFIDEMAQDVPF
ncbi:MAG: ATP-binding protein [Clostridiales Family XIII bacterium]|jgi:hypothetical protein|nr:ATP-binding protein [Clostridiales Family XIII bacterium]